MPWSYSVGSSTWQQQRLSPPDLQLGPGMTPPWPNLEEIKARYKEGWERINGYNHNRTEFWILCWFMLHIHPLVGMADWWQRCPQFSTSPWPQMLCKMTLQKFPSMGEVYFLILWSWAGLLTYLGKTMGGSEGVLFLSWGLESLCMLPLAPLEPLCCCVNRPVTTCWILANIWPRRDCKNHQQSDNHQICEWSHLKAAIPQSPQVSYRQMTE